MSGFSDFLNKIGSGISSVGKPLLGAVSSFAPMAGTILGGMYGGPMGASVGANLGGVVSNMFGGGGGHPAPMQPPMQQSLPQYNQSQPMSTPQFQGIGQRIGQSVNQYLPRELQGQNIGDIGSYLGSNIGGRLNQMLPQQFQGFGFPQMAGSYLGRQLASQAPGGANQTLGGLGQQTDNYLRGRIGYADGGHVSYGGFNDMTDLMGHHYDNGGMVY